MTYPHNPLMIASGVLRVDTWTPRSQTQRVERER